MQHNGEAPFGGGLKAFRKQKKISQAELAEAVGVHTGTVSHWENGRQMPNTATMQKVAEFLGVPTESFVKSGTDKTSELALDEIVAQLRMLSRKSLQIIAPAIRAAYDMERITADITEQKDRD